jgi:hypothetical protein
MVFVYLSTVIWYLSAKSHLSHMNREFFTLLEYTRAEVVLMRKRNATECKLSKVHDPKIENMHNETQEILNGIIDTLDDTITTGKFTWNTLMLSHIIQAFNIHLFSLKTCKDASNDTRCTMLGLDATYIRLQCHIKTVLKCCTSNLVTMCTSPAVSSNRRFSWNNTSSPRASTVDTTPPPMNMSQIRRSHSFIELNPVHVKTSPNPHKKTNAWDVLRRKVRTGNVKDMLHAHSRIGSGLSSAKLMEIYDTATSAIGGIERSRKQEYVSL